MSGTKGSYQCRDCAKRRDATARETSPLFGRVVCYFCGGTCDPTPQEKSKIDACRKRKINQDVRNVRQSGGLYESEKKNLPKGD